jgi:hypothetical protein
LSIDGRIAVALTRGMRSILGLALSGAFLLGCQHSKPSDPGAAKGEAAVGKPANVAHQRTTRGATSTPPTRATPVIESAGAVASVNPDLRFVVIDFHLNPMPKVEQRMGVYREGLKVGEIRISAQSYQGIVAADIMAGEARVGDMVRAE